MGSSGVVKTILIILLVVALVLAAAFGIASMLGGDENKGAAIDFEATTLTGEQFKLSSRYGKGGTALIFFDRATSSKESARALLTNLEAARKGSRVQTVLICKDEADNKALQALLDELKVSADVVIADKAGQVCGTYHVTSCPVTYFIDIEGNVRASTLSALTPSAAEKYIGFIK